MSSEVSLFGGNSLTTQQGKRIGGAVARATQREVEQVSARAEIRAVEEAGQAFLTSLAMTNTAVLVGQAEVHVRNNPAVAPYMEQLIGTYVIGASSRLSRGL